MPTLDESFLRAIAAAKKIEAAGTDRTVIPLGKEGTWATIEDKKIVIYWNTIDDLGCEAIRRFQTKLNINQVNVDPSVFPTVAGYSSNRQQYYISVKHGAWDKREIFFDRDAVPKEGEVKLVLLPPSLLSDNIIGARWKRVVEAVRARGGRVISVFWQKGPVTKSVKKIFAAWAEMVLSGRNGDKDTDDVWEELTVIDKDAADKLYNALRGSNTFQEGFGKSAGPRQAAYQGKRSDLVVLEPVKSPIPGADIPAIVVGKLPDINFCNPPKRT